MRDNSFRTIQLWPKEVLNVQASTIKFFITSQLNNFKQCSPLSDSSCCIKSVQEAVDF